MRLVPVKTLNSIPAIYPPSLLLEAVRRKYVTRFQLGPSLAAHTVVIFRCMRLDDFHEHDPV